MPSAHTTRVANTFEDCPRKLRLGAAVQTGAAGFQISPEEKPRGKGHAKQVLSVETPIKRGLAPVSGKSFADVNNHMLSFGDDNTRESKEFHSNRSFKESKVSPKSHMVGGAVITEEEIPIRRGLAKGEAAPTDPTSPRVMGGLMDPLPAPPMTPTRQALVKSCYGSQHDVFAKKEHSEVATAAPSSPPSVTQAQKLKDCFGRSDVLCPGGWGTGSEADLRAIARERRGAAASLSSSEAQAFQTSHAAAAASFSANRNKSSVGDCFKPVSRTCGTELRPCVTPWASTDGSSNGNSSSKARTATNVYAGMKSSVGVSECLVW